MCIFIARSDLDHSSTQSLSQRKLPGDTKEKKLSMPNVTLAGRVRVGYSVFVKYFVTFSHLRSPTYRKHRRGAFKSALKK